MGITTIIEQEGPRSVRKDEFGVHYFCCSDCESQIETDGRRQAEDLLDTHHCEDVA